MTTTTLLLCILLSLTPCAQSNTTIDNYYISQGIVYSAEADNVTLLDNAGNLWEVQDDTLQEGKLVTMVFYNNGTSNDIKDDTIVYVLDTIQVTQLQLQLQ